jgi:hypothetical protein
MTLFSGRQILIASIHKKEKVIAPILEKDLGLLCLVSEINTDELGTFSGEIVRNLSPLECAKKKCEWAMETHNVDLAIASEGSFGPHPQLFFSYCNEELIVIIDKKNKAEWHARIVSTKTNFNAKSCESLEEVFSFCVEVGFPEHAVILRKDRNTYDEMFKGIDSKKQLEEIASMLLKKHHTVHIETDMRAMHNPTRMKNIEAATRKLTDQLLTFCPACCFPGFSIKQSNPGLPCSGCGLPTKSLKSSLYSCQKCGWTSEKMNETKTFEDPMYCDFCNP